MATVALYIGLNALLLLALAYLVGSTRGAQGQLQPGDMGDAKLTRAIRAHGNYAEYAPTVLLILAALGWLGARDLWLHIIGASFTMGRVIGAVGMMQPNHPNALRFIGNLVTGLVLLVGGGAVIYLALNAS